MDLFPVLGVEPSMSWTNPGSRVYAQARKDRRVRGPGLISRLRLAGNEHRTDRSKPTHLGARSCTHDRPRKRAGGGSRLRAGPETRSSRTLDRPTEIRPVSRSLRQRRASLSAAHATYHPQHRHAQTWEIAGSKPTTPVHNHTSTRGQKTRPPHHLSHGDYPL